MKKLLFIVTLIYPSIILANFIHPEVITVCDMDHHCKKIICDGDFCHDLDGPCPDDRPLKLSSGLCVSCQDTREGDLVHFAKDCKVCPNRKVLEYKGHFYCVPQKAPPSKPLVLKYGYQYCGYCVDEDDILDCSKCLDDFNIVNGKCKTKPERACFQA
ncbi:MAG: hypothetical protein ACI4OR_03960 [Alphaproteobacteria bacterium]